MSGKSNEVVERIFNCIIADKLPLPAFYVVKENIQGVHKAVYKRLRRAGRWDIGISVQGETLIAHAVLANKVKR